MPRKVTMLDYNSERDFYLRLLFKGRIMTNENTIVMTDHPFKTAFAILTGSFVGIKDWLGATHFPLDISTMFSLGAFLIFIIACTKAIIIGCCSWAGASVAGWAKKKITKHFNHKKINKWHK